MILFQYEKVEISRKLAKKVDFRNFLDPFWRFILKRVLGFRDFSHFVNAFGTKNHEMRGPPVLVRLLTLQALPSFQF